MAGIKDVAREAGVSVSTVSYALSGKRPISPKTVARIEEAIERLGYIPDAGAQLLRGRRSGIIAFSSPMREHASEAKYASYFLESAKVAKRHGYDILLLPQEDAVDDIVRVTHSNVADAVLLLDIEDDDARAAAARQYSKPCVAIGLPTEHSYCGCVDLNFAMMGVMAVDYLVERGHRSVAFLRADEAEYLRGSGYVVMFRDSFLRHAEKAGLRVVESLPVDARDFDGGSFVDSLFRGDERPTVIVSQSDADVLNAVFDALEGRGLSVPGDMSVLSCGSYLQGERMTSGVTEFPLIPDELSARAVDLLVDAVEGRHSVAGSVELIPPIVVERGSVSDFLS